MFLVVFPVVFLALLFELRVSAVLCDLFRTVCDLVLLVRLRVGAVSIPKKA